MTSCFLYFIVKEKNTGGTKMEQEKMHDIALMRYSVIAPLITGLQDVL